MNYLLNTIFYINLSIQFFLWSSHGREYEFISPKIFIFPFNRLNIQLNAFKTKFTLELENNLFLSNNYTEIFFTKYSNAPNESSNFLKSNLCHYKGNVNGMNQSWAAVSYCDNKLNGIFEVDNMVYHLQQFPNSQKVKIFVNSAFNHTCGFENYIIPNNNRIRRNVNNMLINDVRRYVELVIVNDFKVFKKYGKNKEFIFNRSKQIVNIVNALYMPLNITVALVGVVVWDDKDEIPITSDSSETLNNFLKYRRDVLMNQIVNDNAQLITGVPFESGIVGKALKQTICTFEYSGGVNYDYSDSISLVATTMAHELGHNFGMEHDTIDCSCRSKSCIMGPSSSYPSPRHWSSCSKDQISLSFKHGMDHCLLNKPKILFRPSCGNGFVDKGEECDCGLVESCNNSCCNATTCKLTSGAQCAHGDCCDKETCKIRSIAEDHICRNAKSLCDIPEKCDGASEYCPKDLVVKDGTECLEGYAYCYAGQCDSRENQCKLLWGKTGEVADYRCFQHNIHANSSGNCGFDKQNRKYVNCDNVKDIICGRLHCSHQNEKLEYGPEAAATISKSRIDFRTGRIYCYSVIIDLGLNEPDPGLVPNGAKCGTNSMCVDQKCVSVAEYVNKKQCPLNCNKNGYCDNEGKCHCFNYSESIDCSYYNNGNLLTIVIYIIFFGIVPLLMLSAFLIYNNQERIKSWFHKQSLVSHDYNIKRQKKHPNNFEITLPLERSDVNEVQANILKPIRKAPPPPPRITKNKDLNSICESGEPSVSIQLTKNRPKKPPPKPPNSDICHIKPQLTTGTKIKTLVMQFENK